MAARGPRDAPAAALYNSQVTFAAESLENQFAATLGFSGAVAAGFGRAALRLALDALDVRSADVLVPDFICAQVPHAARLAGARPVFYRVSADLTVSATQLATAITPATRAAIVAHYFGRPQPSLATLAQICRERRIALVEDCAMALGAGGVGAFGDASVFSFTKTDWCYGGGLLTARSPDLLERARAIRRSTFGPAASLARLYGLLRRADFAANRPARASLAEHCGRALQRLARIPEGNFYDAGRFDSLLPPFAARRAVRLLETLRDVTARRRAIVQRLYELLGPSARLLFRAEPDARDTAAFLLLRSDRGLARRWVERAAAANVTLRLTWPAYQDAAPGQGTTALRWLAEHLLLLEIHPHLNDAEVERIALCLRTFEAAG